MTNRDIIWTSKDKNVEYFGGNGFGHCKGWFIRHYDGIFRIVPINGKNDLATRCFIEIPASEIDNLLTTIQEMRDKLAREDAK